MSEQNDQDFAIRCNAYHEAGHAVAALKFGFPLSDVDIRSRFVAGVGYTVGSMGVLLPRPEELLGKGVNVVMSILVVLLAGVLAERMVDLDAGLDAGPEQSDGTLAKKYAIAAICKPVMENGRLVTRAEDIQRNKDKIDDCINSGWTNAEKFVEMYGEVIDTLGEALAIAKVLSSAQIEYLLRNKLPKSKFL